MFKSISQFLNCGFSESPTSSRSGSLSDDLSSESNVSLSKMEHRSLDFKLLLDEVKSGQQVSQNTWQDFNWKKGFLENLILRQFLFLIRLLFQVTIHLVAPSRQEKAAWLTDIAQVRLRQKKKCILQQRENFLLLYPHFPLTSFNLMFSFHYSVWITYISMDYSTTLCLMPVPPHYLSV